MLFNCSFNVEIEIATYVFKIFLNILGWLIVTFFLRELFFAVDKISSQRFSFRNYFRWYIKSFCKILIYFAQLSSFTHTTESKNNPLKLQGSQAQPWTV